MNNTFVGQREQFHKTILSQRGVMITYRQRGIVIENIPAVPTRTRFLNETNDDRRKTKVVDREYIVEFGLLTWDSKKVEPKPGDNIIEGETVYEVIEREPNQCYRPTDSTELYVRIFVHKTSKTLAALPPKEGCRHTPATKQEIKDLVNGIFGRTLPNFVPATRQEIEDTINDVFN